MAHLDLGSFVTRLRERGEVLDVEDAVDPRLEASAILHLLDRPGGPAVYFSRLKGSRIPAVGNLLGTPERIAFCLGTRGDYRETVARRLGSRRRPRTVSKAPVQEIVLTGKIDLKNLLPVFQYHAGDSGPYITSGILLYRDPASGKVRTGIHRMQVRTRNRLTVQIVGGTLRSLLESHPGESFQAAVVLGAEPGLLLGSVLQLEPEADRLEAAGGLRGRGIEMAAAATLDLPVPARAQVVLEGRLLGGKQVHEGPMGESSGVYTHSRSFLLEVAAITRREKPLYHALLPGSRDEEAFRRVAYAVPMELRLIAEDPRIQGLHLVPGTCGTHGVVSIRKSSEEHPREVIRLCLERFPALKQLTVVDRDVPREDPERVAWALATRFQADRDLVSLPLSPGFPIDPSARRPDGTLQTTRIGLDATAPLKNRARFAAMDPGEKARKKAARILKKLSRRPATRNPSRGR